LYDPHKPYNFVSKIVEVGQFDPEIENLRPNWSFRDNIDQLYNVIGNFHF